MSFFGNLQSTFRERLEVDKWLFDKIYKHCNWLAWHHKVRLAAVCRKFRSFCNVCTWVCISRKLQVCSLWIPCWEALHAKKWTRFHSTHWFSAWILLIRNFWLEGCGVASTFYSKPWGDPKEIRQHLLLQQHVGLYLLRCFCFFFQVIFSGWIQVDNTDTKTKRAQTMLQCPNNFLAMNTLKLQSSTQIFPTLPNHDERSTMKVLSPQNFRSVFFLFWLIPIYGLGLDMIGSHLFINLQVTALAAEKRVRRKRKASGFDRADVKGWAAKRVDICVLTVKKWVCVFFLNRSIFCFSFLEVFFYCRCTCLFGCVFFVLMDAFGSYLKKGGSLVLVCQVDGVPGVQWISSTVPGAHCQIREENQRGKTRASWFLQKRGWKFVGLLFLAKFF